MVCKSFCLALVTLLWHGAVAFSTTLQHNPTPAITWDESNQHPHENTDWYEPKRISLKKCRELTPELCRQIDQRVVPQEQQQHGRQLGASVVSGIKVLVLLIKFSDHQNRDLPGREYFEEMFNGVGPSSVNPVGSVKDWLRYNSNGQYSADYDVRDWVVAPITEAAMAGGVSGWGQDFNKFFAQALDDIDNEPGFDFWPDYVDNTGFLHQLIVIHSGYKAEVGDIKCISEGAAARDRIWSYGSNGSPGGDIWLSKDWYEIGSHSVQSGFYTPGCNDDDQLNIREAPIGPFVHEYSHGFGLPDLYDLNVPPVGGTARFSTMSSSQGWDFAAETPGHLDGWSRQRIGWVEPIEIEYDGYYAVQPLEISSQIYRISHNFPEGEYLLIENKQPLKFDEDVPGGGIVIYHIDMEANQQKNVGYPGSPGWPTDHYRVAVQQADGNYDIEKGVNIGDEGDFFRRGDKLSSGGDFPNTDSYQGGTIQSTGITIEVLTDSAFIMVIKVSGLGRRSAQLPGGALDPLLEEITERDTTTRTIEWIVGMLLSVSLMLGMLFVFL